MIRRLSRAEMNAAADAEKIIPGLDEISFRYHDTIHAKILSVSTPVLKEFLFLPRCSARFGTNPTENSGPDVVPEESAPQPGGLPVWWEKPLRKNSTHNGWRVRIPAKTPLSCPLYASWSPSTRSTQQTHGPPPHRLPVTENQNATQRKRLAPVHRFPNNPRTFP